MIKHHKQSEGFWVSSLKDSFKHISHVPVINRQKSGLIKNNILINLKYRHINGGKKSSVCVCVRERACACERACARSCVHVCPFV